MPNMPFLYAMDFIEVLKKKHAAGTYKEMVKGSVLALRLVPDHIHSKFFNMSHILHMLISLQVIYVEACESGSIFEGIMPKDMNIYVTTASNAQENSWGTYCPGMEPSPPPEYITCLGDLYSVAWMEDRYEF